MDIEQHQKKIVSDFFEQFKHVFVHSDQAIYLYLDDKHKVCNKKFSDMLGYKSEQEWASVQTPFTNAFVDDKSRRKLVKAYMQAIETSQGSTIPVTWKTKQGKKIKTNVILVPVMQSNHVMALHFITKAKR